jgi:hypothetical protein
VSGKQKKGRDLVGSQKGGRDSRNPAISFVPSGLKLLPRKAHDLRRGLDSWAAISREDLKIYRGVSQRADKLKFFEEFAAGAGNIDATWYAALAVFGALDDACRFAALGAVCGLGCVHLFFAISGLCDFCHLDVLRSAGLGKAGRRYEDDCGNSQLCDFT